MTLTPKQEWWTTTELAASGLPDVPDTRQGVDAMAERQHWRAHPHHARRRSGRGGGWEYCWRLLPARAQRRLLAEVAPAGGAGAERPERDPAWAWFERLPEAVQGKARAKLLVIQAVEALEPVLGLDQAIRQVAAAEGKGVRTIWGWLSLVEGVRPDDRLPYLADRHRVETAPRGARPEVAPDFFELIKSDFLRSSGPSFSSCYRRQLRVAKKRGFEVLPEWRMRRHLNATISRVTQTLCREGLDAVKRMYPTQVRDKTCLQALEAVNGDYHKFDVFVRWPVERGQSDPPYVGRPQMVAFQDIYSGRILSWRVDQTANSNTVLLAAGEMIEDWGIPEHVLLDNGREFAAKAISGGTPNRYRFTMTDEDVPGLFTALGCQIHWATPYSGQSKPIERAFRDMCDNIAKDPRFDGAWTGNRPDAKPEDYGSRAIDLEEFLRVLAEGIEEHNTRVGRRSEVAYGRSFVDVFDESYAQAPIRRATEAQRRLWLMGAKGIRANSRNGQLSFMGNKYWADWMPEIAGQAVVIRFDSADLWSGLHVYTHDNIYLGHAPTFDRAGFFDTEEAKLLARAKRDWLKAEREAAKAHRRFTARELGRMLDEVSPVEPPKPEAKVVRLAPVKATRRGRPVDAPAAETTPASVTTLPLRPVPEAAETARERFRRALELERAADTGATLTSDQRRWLAGYQTTSEYRTERRLHDNHGDEIFG
jgi:hypothetical protein